MLTKGIKIRKDKNVLDEGTKSTKVRKGKNVQDWGTKKRKAIDVLAKET